MIRKILTLTMTIVVAICSICSLSATAYAASTNGIQGGQPYGDDGTIYLTDSVATAMKQSGAGIVRVLFRLGNCTTDSAEWYAAYDQIVNNLTSKGITVIGVLNGELISGYNQNDWCANNVENGGTNGYNDFIDTFGYMCARVASHFNGIVKKWEVWNEPDCWSQHPTSTVYTGGSFMYPSNFQALLGHIYTQLKYYNNFDCEIISGGLFGHDISGKSQANSGANYLDSTYSMGINYGSWSWINGTVGTYPLDHIGSHIYISQGETVASSDITNYCNWMKDAYTYYEGGATNKKLFVTEYGWQTPVTYGVSEAVQATNITTCLNAFNSLSYIGGTDLFFLQDIEVAGLCYGIFRQSGLSGSDKKTGWTNFNFKTSEEGQYSNGAIDTGIRDHFNNNGGMVSFGLPFDNGGTKWVHSFNGNPSQDYRGGSYDYTLMISSSSGTYRIVCGFRDAYLYTADNAQLVAPVNNEYKYGAGTRQDFVGGYMTWDPTNSTQIFYY